MADNNEYGWGLSRNLPILIILLIILGFLVANVITFNDIAVAPEDPNQTITKSRASYLYWFNLIILLFVLTIIILLVMFMWRNKNTPNVDYFGKNITIIDATTGKNIKKDKNAYKSKKSLEEIATPAIANIQGLGTANSTEPTTSVKNYLNSSDSNYAKVLAPPPAAGPVGGIITQANLAQEEFKNRANKYCAKNNIPLDQCSDVTKRNMEREFPCENTNTTLECYNAINEQLESLNQ